MCECDCECRQDECDRDDYCVGEPCGLCHCVADDCACCTDVYEGPEPEGEKES